MGAVYKAMHMETSVTLVTLEAVTYYTVEFTFGQVSVGPYVFFKGVITSLAYVSDI